VDFRELAEIGAEPSPTHLASFVVAYLETHASARRSDLINAAEIEWLRENGSPMKTALVPRMKKALAILTAQGSIRQSGAYGIWVLSEAAPPASSTSVRPPTDLHRGDDHTDSESLAQESDDEPGEDDRADRVVGIGHQQVYCFYLDAYRDLALSRGESTWPIKIGMSAGQLSARLEAHRTALPEAPHLALLIETDNAATLEKVIHGVLTLRGKRSEGTGGAEWFTTTPDEIEEIYRSTLGPQDAGVDSRIHQRR
jgi:hypothetical protein